MRRTTAFTSISWIMSTRKHNPRKDKAKSMPKMRVPDEELNIDEMEEAEYTEGSFSTYDGEQPPKGTILVGVVQKMWWGYNRKEEPMLTIVWVADGNTGKNEQYDGLQVWDHITLAPSSKFRWKPFIDVMGITLREIKTGMVLAADDDNVGAPIQKIGKTWVPDTDPAYCRILTKREKFQGDFSTKVDTYMDYEEPDADADAEDEPEEEVEETPAPTRTRRSRKAAEPEPEADDEEDEEDEEELDEEDEEEEEPEDEDEPEEEEEPEPAKPAGRRSTRTAAKPAAPAAPARATRTAAKPAAAPAKAAAPARRRSARTATAAAKPAPARGRRAAAPTEDNEPPF
jgi:hypothetical protein